MKPVRSFSLLFVLFAISLCRAAEPPVTDLYMKALVAGVKNAIGWQSDDGRYNRSAQDKNQPVQDLLATTQMAIGSQSSAHQWVKVSSRPRMTTAPTMNGLPSGATRITR